MAHTASCAEAKGDTCACAGCGGSEHGWGGGIWLATAGGAAERDRLAAKAERDWRANFDEEHPVSNRFNRQAALASAKLGLIQWLARNCSKYLGQAGARPVASVPQSAVSQPGSNDQKNVLQELAKRKGEELPNLLDETYVKAINDLGGAIARETIREIDKLFTGDKKKQNEVRKQLAKHFWCDLFATLAHAIDQFKTTLNKVPDWVTDAILQSPHKEKRPLITRLIVRTAVRHAWKIVQHAIEHTLGITKVLVILRVLAVLCCPKPEKHQAVIEYCVVPLGNAVLEPAIKAVLLEELTQDLNLDAPTLVD